MDFSFTSDQEALRHHVKQLLDKVCPPEYAEHCDNEAQPPRAAYEALAKQGWFGLILPVEYGGSGGSAVELAILLEETGRHFEELAIWVFRTLTYGGYAVMRDGTPEQKATLLPKILRGEISFCFGLTEPQSGSDAAALTTRATSANGGFIINGQKTWCSNAHFADHLLLVARTNTSGSRHEGLTMFCVPAGTPGMEIRGIPTMSGKEVNDVYFTDCFLPESAIVGKVDQAWPQLMSGLNSERLILAASMLGRGRRAFDDALAYVKERKQFGRSVGSFQALKHRIADLALELDCCELLLYRVAAMADEQGGGLGPLARDLTSSASRSTRWPSSATWARPGRPGREGPTGNVRHRRLPAHEDQHRLRPHPGHDPRHAAPGAG